MKKHTNLKNIIILAVLVSLSVFSYGGTMPTTINDEFITAVQKNDLAKVKQMLSQENIDINYKDKEGFTPLMFAAINNYKPMAELLLTQKNLNLDSTNVYGYKAITLAAIFGNSGIIKILKKAGAKE